MSLVRYEFEFPEGRRWQHAVPLSVEPLPLPPELPGWTRLDCNQCANCPLSGPRHVHCPLAAALVAPVAGFAGDPSWTPVSVRVTTPERTTSVDTTLQRAVGSLIGLLSALSGCPHTRPLLPMALFHLPFSTAEETLFRVMGTYLSGQRVRKQAGLSPDWDLHGLVEIYRNLHIVNGGIAARIRAAAEHDSTVNAVVLLDVLAMDMRASLELLENDLASAFAPYLAQP